MPLLEKRTVHGSGRFYRRPAGLKLDPSGDVLKNVIELNNICDVFDIRETAFEKIRMRVPETAMSAAILGERHAG
jgi:hypothetical protein